MSQEQKITEILSSLTSDDEIPPHIRRTPSLPLPPPSVLAEELLAHPFFMKTPLDQVDPSTNPHVAALQSLKYCPLENTPHELALSHKQDGLFHYKLKKYRIAAAAFTEALKHAQISDDDRELVANLYNNRGACHFHVENYGSALRDFAAAIQLKPDYVKSLKKAVECCLKLEKVDQGIDFLAKLKCCDIGDDILDYENKLDFLEKENQEKSAKNCQKNVESAKKSSKLMEKLAKIKLANENFLENDEVAKVKLINNLLHWPVVLFYPEYSQSDFIEEFCENDCLKIHLETILDQEPANWDKNGHYTCDQVDVYFIASDCQWILVDKKVPLLQILQNERYTLPSTGIPGFLILSKNSEFCKFYLQRVQGAM